MTLVPEWSVSVEVGMTMCSALSLSLPQSQLKGVLKGLLQQQLLEYCDIVVLINSYKIFVKTEDAILA